MRTRSGADDMLGDVFNWLSMNTLSARLRLHPLAAERPVLSVPFALDHHRLELVWLTALLLNLHNPPSSAPSGCASHLPTPLFLPKPLSTVVNFN